MQMTTSTQCLMYGDGTLATSCKTEFKGKVEFVWLCVSAKDVCLPALLAKYVLLFGVILLNFIILFCYLLLSLYYNVSFLYVCVFVYARHWQIQTPSWEANPPFPSPPFPFSSAFPFPPSFPSLFWEVGPLNTARESVSSPSGVYGRAPVEIEFGAF